jgi:tryptophanyl-tRNA synthetase
LGHLVGTLRKWVELQGVYESYFLLADWHALTTDYAHTERLADNIYETVYDWLAAGVNPRQSTIFLQSRVPEHAELQLLLSMLVSVGRLERNPTYKEQKAELHLGANASLGLLAYPVLQAADVLMYQAEAVPVGQDQLPHLELTREIARRFNSTYGALFPEPQAVLSVTPRLVGLDGRTMHSSYGNTIALSEDPNEIRRKVASMVTDPRRIRKTDPGHPDVCSVFALVEAVFPANAMTLNAQCQAAEIGCVSCKQGLAEQLIELLEPFRRIRSELSHADLDELIEQGDERARKVAQATMAEVRARMKLDRVPGKKVQASIKRKRKAA